MTQIDKDRFFSMAQTYDKMVSFMLPRCDWLRNELIGLLFADGREDKLIVDLGAGSGILLDMILARFPAAHGCWVDYSNDFGEIARNRLAQYSGRVAFIDSALESSWETQLAERPDAICSMSAIHHLETDEKRALYARCFDTLKPGGLFVNLDEMRTLYDESYIDTMQYWVDHCDGAHGDIPAELAEDYDSWQTRFAKWRMRNIDNADKPKAKGDDIHEGYVEQMQWLHAIGFESVDLFFKFQLWSAIGGHKPL